MNTATQPLDLFGPMPPKESMFLVTSYGDYNAAVLVMGMAGLRNEVTEIFMADASAEPDEMCQGILDALANPQEWIDNGHSQGDGEPFWHIQFSFEDGWLSVQRITSIKC